MPSVTLTTRFPSSLQTVNNETSRLYQWCRLFRIGCIKAKSSVNRMAGFGEVLNRMKYLLVIVLAGSVLAGPGGFGDDRAIPVSLIQLLANPDKFDGKLVTVQGFLNLEHEKHHGARGFLFLHPEDANHLLGSNAADVVPSEQMLRDQEKIDGMYVTMTGLLQAVPGASGSYGVVIKGVRSCLAWSDPRRPIGLKREDEIRDADKK